MTDTAPAEPQRSSLQIVSTEIQQIEGIGREEWKAATQAERLTLLQRVCDTVTTGCGTPPVAVSVEPITGTRRSEYDQQSRTIRLEGALLVDGYLRKTAVKAVLRQTRRAVMVDARLAADAEQALPSELESLARLAVHDHLGDGINVYEYDATSFSRGVLRHDSRFRRSITAPKGAIPAGIGALTAGGAVALAFGLSSGTQQTRSAGGCSDSNQPTVVTSVQAEVPYSQGAVINFLRNGYPVYDSTPTPIPDGVTTDNVVNGPYGSWHYDVTATVSPQGKTALRYTVYDKPTCGVVQNLGSERKLAKADRQQLRYQLQGELTVMKYGTGAQNAL